METICYMAYIKCVTFHFFVTFQNKKFPLSPDLILEPLWRSVLLFTLQQNRLGVKATGAEGAASRADARRRREGAQTREGAAKAWRRHAKRGRKCEKKRIYHLGQ